MKRTLILLFSVAVSLCCIADEMPDGYYNAADGKSDAALKTALYNIIRVGQRYDYGSGSGHTWEIFYYSDRDTLTNRCLDMYSDEVRYFTTPGAVVSGCNIEHSLAKSWWGGNKNDAYKDCYHLNPSDTKANSARGSYPLGEVVNVTQQEGSLLIGTNPAYGSFTVWEPKDEYKGDFARAYFYMVTCYENLSFVGNTNAKTAMQDKNYLVFQPWFQEVLIQWHRQDPVSSKEIDRADAVNNFQHNRNPFIDYPCLAEYIWGNKKGESVDFATLKFTRDDDYLSLPEADKCGCNGEITDPTITAPRNGSSLDFGTAGIGETVAKTITVKGVLLAQNLSVQLVGSQAGEFAVSPTELTAEQALNGIGLEVEFTPTTLGKASAQLVISSSELARATTVNLTAVCGFHALPATNVTSSGFTANWVNGGVESYSLDVYRREERGVSETVIIDEKGLSSASVSANAHLSTSGKTHDENGSLRLGTSSGDGTITISDIDMTRGATLVVNAKSYGSDQSTLAVTVGDKLLETITLTSSFADYTITIPATSATAIVLSQGTSGKRVNIANLLLKAGGTAIVNVSLDGFPLSVSGLSYDVAAAVSNDDPLYYTVTPQGGDTSNEIVVKLTQETAISVPTADMPVCVARDGRIECNVAFRIFDLVGRDVTAANGSLCGIYIVRTAQTVQKVIVTK